MPIPAAQPAAELAVAEAANPRSVWIEHPSDKVDALLTCVGSGAILKITADTMRTARPIMRAEVYVPKALFVG